MDAALAPLVASEVPPADRLSAPGLLVVDMQNDFVRAGAPLEVPDARATIVVHQRLLAAFRARRLPVLYTRFVSLAEDNLLGAGRRSATRRRARAGRSSRAATTMRRCPARAPT